MLIKPDGGMTFRNDLPNNQWAGPQGHEAAGAARIEPLA